jgi:cytochrome bd ubiquinol oxidase subunit II
MDSALLVHRIHFAFTSHSRLPSTIFFRKQQDKAAFVGSALYVVGMLVGAAFALYPVVLPASTNSAYSLTISNTAAAQDGLTVGIAWRIIAMVLALGYFTFLFRMFRGKVRLEGEGY